MLRLQPDCKSITVAVGQTFALDLEAQAGVGYEWIPIRDFSEISYLGQETDGPTPQGVPHVITQRLWFRALAPGEFQVRLLYKRRWETSIHSEMLVIVKVEPET
jgi:predicted secreted protein